MKICIDDRVRAVVPDLALGVVTAAVRVTDHDPDLWTNIDQIAEQTRDEVRPETITELPAVRAARDAYRRLGADPNRYRGSAEALLRRVISGRNLYRVNTVVDVNNLVSLVTRQPVGSYDRDRIVGPVVFRTGGTDEIYRGIGKTVMTLTGIPLLADDSGPFGNPSSDSERTMIRPDTTRLAVVVFAFDGLADLPNQCQMLAKLLMEHAAADDVTAEVSGLENS